LTCHVHRWAVPRFEHCDPFPLVKECSPPDYGPASARKRTKGGPRGLPGPLLVPLPAGPSPAPAPVSFGAVLLREQRPTEAACTMGVESFAVCVAMKLERRCRRCRARGTERAADLEGNRRRRFSVSATPGDRRRRPSPKCVDRHVRIATGNDQRRFFGNEARAEEADVEEIAIRPLRETVNPPKAALLEPRPGSLYVRCGPGCARTARRRRRRGCRPRSPATKRCGDARRRSPLPARPESPWPPGRTINRRQSLRSPPLLPPPHSSDQPPTSRHWERAKKPGDLIEAHVTAGPTSLFSRSDAR